MDDDFEVKPLQPAAETPALKVGARNSAADLAHIQAAHDHLVGLGAQCAAGADMGDRQLDGEADKGALPEGLAKVLAENARLRSEVDAIGPRFDDLRRTIETLEKRLEEVAAQPVAPRAMAGAVRAVSKTEDADPTGRAPPTAEDIRKYFDSLPETERGQAELRAALSRPMAIGR
jgi:hypothetical protein